MAYSPDPRLIAAIRQYAAPGDRAIALATALVESGGRLDAVGDHGQSFGPYQEYTGGRGAGIAPAQRQDPVGSTQRFLRELAQYRSRGFSGGELAYRTQRPADHAGYVQKINAALPVAKQLLGAGGGARAAGAPQGTREAPGGAPLPGGGGQLTPQSLAAIQEYAARTRAEVMAGQMPSPVDPVLARLRFSGGGRAEGRDDPRRAQGPDPAGYSPVRFSAGGGPDAHHSRALGNWQSDDAYDLMGKAGNPVYAMVNGTVTKISGQPGGDPGFAGYGITVRTPQGDLFFKHLGSKRVAVGDRITPRTLVGTLDPSTAGGPHLHLGGTNRSQLDTLYRLMTGGR